MFVINFLITLAIYYEHQRVSSALNTKQYRRRRRRRRRHPSSPEILLYLITL